MGSVASRAVAERTAAGADGRVRASALCLLHVSSLASGCCGRGVTVPDAVGGSGSRLSSKVVMVVGVTSGIGRAVAPQVAAEGAAVVAAGRRVELGTGLVAEIVDGRRPGVVRPL
jgi:hypothetical protein